MREVVLDTETTGFDPDSGHRIVEIACLELQNHMPTGRHFQQYVHPERGMPEEAFKIHGLSAEFLSGFPVFGEVADRFLEFIAEAPLVIHNAAFDLKFLNAELAGAGRTLLLAERAVDTVALARRRFPGAQASLDALCRRFGIDNSARTTHGARLDAELLAEVYLELTGGRQAGLGLDSAGAKTPPADAQPVNARAPRPHAPTDEELEAHAELVKGLNKPIWTE